MRPGGNKIQGHCTNGSEDEKWNEKRIAGQILCPSQQLFFLQ